MDTILQTGYGVKIDSLAEPNNPLTKNVLEIFSKNLSIKNLLTVLVIFFLPKLSRALQLRFCSKQFAYFEKFALEIIRQKRQLFSSDGRRPTSGTNLIELMLEAEFEAKQNPTDTNIGKCKINFFSNKIKTNSN